MSSTHADRNESVRSGRSFGLVFAIVFALIGLYPLLGGGTARTWSLGLAVLMLAFAALAPAALALPARLWLRLGDALHRVVSLLVLALIFFGVICPFALAMRVIRRDALRLGFDKAASSYWIARDPAGPDPDSIRNQF